MEFHKGPNPVTPEYRRRVAGTLEVSRITYSGLFQPAGTFDVVRLGERTESGNTTPMWALNLLRFTYANDGVRTTKNGFLIVYHGRMTRDRRDEIIPVHTIDPGNVRFVDEWRSFRTIGTASGWVLDEPGSWTRRFDDTIPNERLEEILTNAEAGKKPPFFDDHTEFVKIEPGFAGRMVYVIRFYDVNDSVVVDTESRELVGKYTQDLLSRKRWEPKLV